MFVCCVLIACCFSCIHGQELLPTSALPPIGTTALPQVGTSALPPIGTTALPDVGTSALPQVGTTALPDVGTSALPPIGTTSLPDISTSGLPQVGATTALPGGKATTAVPVPSMGMVASSVWPSFPNVNPTRAGDRLRPTM